MDTDHWFESYLREDDERDYAEEDYWRNRCPACDQKHQSWEPCDEGVGGSFTFHTYLPEEMTAPPARLIPAHRRPTRLGNLADLAALTFLGLYLWWADSELRRWVEFTVGLVVALLITAAILLGFEAVTAHLHILSLVVGK